MKTIISSRSKDLGGGFIVRRTLPAIHQKMVGPFIFWDHFGPVDFVVGNGLDVRPHPHIGLSTLTYLFEGEIIHRDTLGFEQAIRPGAVNWMTAGRGIAHSERSSKESRKQTQKLHGLQIWMALPKEKEEVAPSFNHHPEKDIPEISAEGLALRVVAGKYQKEKSPVQVHTPTTYWDLRISKNKTFEFEQAGHELAVYCAQGKVEVDGKILSEGDMGILSSAPTVVLRTLEASRAIVLGGEPFKEERHIWWNFVSFSQERIEKAKADWVNKSFGQIKGETEFIPLPEK